MSNNISLPPSGANAIPVTVVGTPPSGGVAIPVSGYDTYPTDRSIAGALPINVIVIRDTDLVENGGNYTLAANQFAVPVFTAPDELGQPIGNTPLAVYPVNGWQPDVPQVVQDPTFSPVAGTYATTQNVTISTTTSGATIRYTTDGSTPSESVGTIYTTPVAISANATLKAIAYKSGWTDSQVVSGAYIIGIAPTFSSAEVGNVNATTVAATFSENVSASNYATGVTIKVNGSGVTISSATRQSNHALVYYVITPAVVFGDTVTWEYAQASGNIVGETGGIALANVSAQSVTNSVPAWWQAGGATGAVAAYQPKGAGSLAASYTNLANPGTNNASPIVAPTWDATNGWKFDGTQYLDSTVIPAGTTYSALVQFSNFTSTDGVLFGLVDAKQFYIYVRSLDVEYANGSANDISPKPTNGNLGISDAAYRNGTAEGAALTGANTGTHSIYIGEYNNAGSAGGLKAATYIQALVIYSTLLAAAQMAAVAAAMAAL